MSLEDINLLLKKNNFDFHYLDVVNSTMSEIKYFNSENNICLMANKQTNGVGRRGASWKSPNNNVYISILLKNILDIKNHFLNTAYTANIICDVLENICNVETKIKWPNDILIKDKKICGIISEIYNINNDVLVNTGFGVNIISSPKVENYKTTNVNENNKKIDNIKFVYKLMEKYLFNFDLLKGNSKSVIKQYKSRLKYLKTNIKLEFEDSHIREGIFHDLNDDGSIIFETNSSNENIYNARIIK